MKDLIEKINSLQINVSERMILDRFVDRYRWFITYPWGQPTIEVLDKQNGQLVDPWNFFSREDGFLITENLLEKYNDGCTLIVSNIGELFPDFKKVSDEIVKTIGHRVNINMYMGRGGGRRVSFEPHTHDYDVIVKNVYGVADWINCDENVILKDQETLFIPKEGEHCVTKIYGKKCSLTCNIQY